MEVWILKLILSIVTMIVIIVFGLMPILWKKFKANKMLISLTNCFSGGLFLALGLIHVLPEAEKNLESLSEEIQGLFPVAHMIALLSFMLLFFVERIGFNNHDLSHDQTNKKETQEKDKSVVEPEVQRSMEIMAEVRRSVLGTNENDENNPNEISEEQIREITSSRFKVAHGLAGLSQTVHTHPSLATQEILPVLNLVEVPQDHCHKEGHCHELNLSNKNILKAYFVLTALGLHSFFEGLAFGSTFTIQQLVSIFVAIILHKWSEALTVGVSFVKSGLPKVTSIIMFIFYSLFTALGIFIGSLVEHNEIISSIFLSISAGSFIYISCSEIVTEEFSVSKNKFLKFMFMILGIVCIIISNLFDAD